MAKRTPKTRNAGTMTESAFWTMIRSVLRKRSIFWKPRQECKLAARRPNESENTRLSWEYQCAECKQWVPDKNTHVDHEVEVGTLKCADDLPGFVENLFAETGYRLLCIPCHLKHTKKQREDAKNRI